MAYFLQKTSSFSSATVEMTATDTTPLAPYFVDTGAATQVSYDLEFEARVDGSDLIVIGYGTSSTRIIFLTSSDNFELRESGQTFTTSFPSGFSDFRVFRLEYRETDDGAGGYDRVVTLFIDGTQQDTYDFGASRPEINEFNEMFTLGNSTRHGSLKYLSFTDNLDASNNRYYDADASNGTGSVLPETTGNGTDGTLVGFPTDDSQWVFYSTGPSLTITDPIIPGTTTTFSTADFVDPLTGVRITDSSGNVKELTLASQTSVSAPAVGDLDYALFGDVTLEVYNDTESATGTTPFNPPAGFNQIALEAGFATDQESFLYQYGGTPAVPDQMAYDPIASDTGETLTLQTNGYWTATGYGEWTVHAIDATDGYMEPFQFIWKSGSTPGNIISMRARRLKARANTAKPLRAR